MRRFRILLSKRHLVWSEHLPSGKCFLEIVCFFFTFLRTCGEKFRLVLLKLQSPWSKRLVFNCSYRNRHLLLGDMWRQVFGRSNELNWNFGEKLLAHVVKAAISKSREIGNDRFVKKNCCHFLNLERNT